jgi:hypothetical protein
MRGWHVEQPSGNCHTEPELVHGLAMPTARQRAGILPSTSSYSPRGISLPQAVRCSALLMKLVVISSSLLRRWFGQGVRLR